MRPPIYWWDGYLVVGVIVTTLLWMTRRQKMIPKNTERELALLGEPLAALAFAIAFSLSTAFWPLTLAYRVYHRYQDCRGQGSK